MAQRRMIDKRTIQTQKFLRLPLETQALYFHLMLNADDDGVVEAFPIMRMVGASEDNLGLLVIKQFIKPINDEMVYFIIDFLEQNTIRKDTYKPSKYAGLIDVDEPLTERQRIVDVDKNRLDKNRLDKNRLDKNRLDKNRNNIVENFESLWKLYPRKIGKTKALSAYKKAIKSGVTDEAIKSGIEYYVDQIKSKHTKTEYIKHGSTWFANQGWEDDYEPRLEPQRQEYTDLDLPF